MLFFLQNRVHFWSSRQSPVTFQDWKNKYFRTGPPTFTKAHLDHKIIVQPYYYKLSGDCKRSTASICYSYENQQPAEFVRNNTKLTLQPVLVGLKKCTMLLLHNLAQPEWISVRCDDLLQTHVVCEEYRRNISADNKTGTHTQEVCHRSQIFSGQECISFFWIRSGFMLNQNLSEQCQLLRKVKNTRFESFILHNLDIFAIFLATNLVTFATISSLQPHTQGYQSVVFERYWISVSTVERNLSEGFIPCVSSKHKYLTVRDLFFHCANGTIISSAHIADGDNDCNPFTNDENYFKHPSPDTKMCFTLFYYSVERKCKSFVQHNFQNTSDRKIGNEFLCFNGLTISDSVVDDLVPDCGDDANDETLYLSLQLNHTYNLCRNPSDLPCVPGHPRCFSFSHICIYRLNLFHHLEPCRTGSHLQSCNSFICNGHFKCPQFYCVPWGYVCNGLWDCPWAHDEMYQTCANRNCKDMFKCKHFKPCIWKMFVTVMLIVQREMMN